MADLANWHRRLTDEGPASLAERLLLALLRLVAALFSGVTRLRAALYRRGWLRVYRAPVPVISVGNLAVGGTGKTPVTDYLVKELLARGLRVAVVSRGYGGSGVPGGGLVSAGAGPLVGPPAAGDEPYLLARRNPQALVLVNPRRRAAVAAAVEEHGAQVVVLDDGFQHLAVARDLDIVLLDARRPLGNGYLLPAGRLREPVAALERADLLLFTRHSGGPLPALPVKRPVLACRHLLAPVAFTLEGEERLLAGLAGQRAVAFAGIADPAGFFAAPGRRGSDPGGDAGAARPRALRPAAAGAPCGRRGSGPSFLITTEKDAVKLAGAAFAVPCYQVPLKIVFDEPERLAAILDNCLQGKEVA